MPGPSECRSFRGCEACIWAARATVGRDLVSSGRRALAACLASTRGCARSGAAGRLVASAGHSLAQPARARAGTAVSLWITASVGIAAAYCLYALAVVLSVITLLTLSVLKPLKKHPDKADQGARGDERD